MIKVLIVDDSAFIRKLIRQIVEKEKDMQVVGEAEDGRQATEMARSCAPDVITLDIIMPGKDGLWALEEINRQSPTPVIVFSSISTPMAETTAEAFRLGVIDVVQKPGEFENINMVRHELVEKIRLASMVERKKLIAFASQGYSGGMVINEGTRLSRKIIVIGSSAGGPPALYGFLSKLPSSLDAGIVIGQHIPASFVEGFALHIKKVVPFFVKVAEDGDIVNTGRVLISPPDNTVTIVPLKHGGMVQLEKTKGRYKPSIDTIFESAAKVYGRHCVGVILSGMANDGTQGFGAIHKAGGRTFAQNEATSIVYGMPKAAAEAGVVDAVGDVETLAKLAWEAVAPPKRESVN
jgi:two-component system chemotaxis response regulator CheB